MSKGELLQRKKDFDKIAESIVQYFSKYRGCSGESIDGYGIPEDLRQSILAHNRNLMISLGESIYEENHPKTI